MSFQYLAVKTYLSMCIIHLGIGKQNDIKNCNPELQ